MNYVHARYFSGGVRGDLAAGGVTDIWAALAVDAFLYGLLFGFVVGGIIGALVMGMMLRGGRGIG